MIKSDKFPLRLLVLRALEFIGKVFLVPLILLWFLYNFPISGKPHEQAYCTVLCCVFGAFIFTREVPGIRSTFRESIYLVRLKIDNPAANNITDIELFVFNYVTFRKFSLSASHYHRQKRELEAEFEKETEMEQLRATAALKLKLQEDALYGRRQSITGILPTSGANSIVTVSNELNIDDSANVTAYNIPKDVDLLQNRNSVISAMHEL